MPHCPIPRATSRGRRSVPMSSTLRGLRPSQTGRLASGGGSSGRIAAKGSTGVGSGAGRAAGPAAAGRRGRLQHLGQHRPDGEGGAGERQVRGQDDEGRRDGGQGDDQPPAQPVAARARRPGRGAGRAPPGPRGQRAASALAQPRQSSAARFRASHPADGHPVRAAVEPLQGAHQGRPGVAGGGQRGQRRRRNGERQEGQQGGRARRAR